MTASALLLLMSCYLAQRHMVKVYQLTPIHIGKQDSAETATERVYILATAEPREGYFAVVEFALESLV